MAKTLKVGGFLDEFEKDDVKAKVDIITLFQELGVLPMKKGANYVAFCPWHKEKTPSLSIDREKKLYNCFGCGESGDPFTLVMKMKDMDFKQALSYLKKGKFISTEPAERPAVKASAEKKPLGKSTPEKVISEKKPEPQKTEQPKTQPEKKAEQLKAPKKTIKTSEVQEVKIPEEDVNLSSLMNIVAVYYNKTFKSETVLSYLEKRDLGDMELVHRFDIGYCNGTLKKKISEKQFQALQEAGLFTDKGYELFKGCITFPLYDENKQVVGFYGRKTDDDLKVKHLYMKGADHQGLFNREALKVYRDEIILTESVIDSLSLIKLGVENTVPCYGTNGFRDIHLKALKDNRVKTVVIGFDNDEPGNIAKEKVKEILLKEGFAVKTLSTVLGKDWNDFLRFGGTKKDLLEYIKTLQPEKLEKERYTYTEEKGKHIFDFVDILYRVAGVKDSFISNLRVNMKVEKEGKSDLDNVDLYSARSRNGFMERISSLLDMPVARIEKDLMSIIDYLEKMRDGTLEEEEAEIVLTEEEKELGLKFLKSPDLFDQIAEDTESLGYVGETLNKQLIYLSATSRLLDDPISVTVISQSASGKSYLIDTVKKLIPEEDVLTITTLSDQALNYLPEDALLHKFLAFGEAVHSDIIDHQIREMLSSKELSRLVTTKDDKTGKMVSKTVRKDVIVSTVMSSTNVDINPENASRVFVVNTDESIEQTKRIHKAQREKYSLKRFEKKKVDNPEIIRKHKSAQRLLRKLLIVNPFAEHLTFPDTLMRTRRDHERFIDLMSAVCFLRQYQKEVKTYTEKNNTYEYIECDLEDYRISSEIMKGILSATMVNIPKGAITLYEELRVFAEERAEEEGGDIEPKDIAFTQREIREHTGNAQMFVKRNMKILVDYEYVQRTGGINGKKNTYKLFANEKIELIDLSIIPSPEVMEEIINKKLNTEGKKAQ